LRKEPEIITVTLKKQNGMGLSIVAAKVWKSVCVSVTEKTFLFVCFIFNQPTVENVNGKISFL